MVGPAEYFENYDQGPYSVKKSPVELQLANIIEDLEDLRFHWKETTKDQRIWIIGDIQKELQQMKSAERKRHTEITRNYDFAMGRWKDSI